MARRRRPPSGLCPAASPSGGEGRGGRWGVAAAAALGFARAAPLGATRTIGELETMIADRGEGIGEHTLRTVALSAALARARRLGRGTSQAEPRREYATRRVAGRSSADEPRLGILGHNLKSQNSIGKCRGIEGKLETRRRNRWRQPRRPLLPAGHSLRRLLRSLALVSRRGEERRRFAICGEETVVCDLGRGGGGFAFIGC